MQEFLGEISPPKLHQDIKLSHVIAFMPYKNPAMFSYY